MKSELFKLVGIPAAECEVEAWRDDLKVPRLLFKSEGNPVVGLDIGGATKLREMMMSAGDEGNAKEIDALIEKARRYFSSEKGV